jgi:hypothetical protein
MTKTEIDVMWSRALREALEAGEEFTRYRFAAMVASAEREAEREACAKVCEELQFSESGPSTQAKFQRDLCAKAIRARGEQ